MTKNGTEGMKLGKWERRLGRIFGIGILIGFAGMAVKFVFNLHHTIYILGPIFAVALVAGMILAFDAQSDPETASI